MYLRSDNDGPRRQASAGKDTRRVSAPSRMSSERVREIRDRVERDAYRSADVADEIARRILRSRDL